MEEVRSNLDRLRTIIRQTPSLELPLRPGPDQPLDVWLKLEVMQVAGSFKVRGAFTVVDRLDQTARSQGLVTVSSGNHAIATAYVARQFGCPARVYMSAAADPYRISMARNLGADVRLSHGVAAAFDDAAGAVSREGMTLVHPFEGPLTTLGNASIALELHSQLPTNVDVYVVAIGGGGLVSGIAPAIKALRPGALVYGVEPTGAPTLSESLRAGRPSELMQIQTIADSLAPPITGPNTFALVRDYVDEILLVTDDQIRAAMIVLLHDLKLMIEPSGAAALAAVLAHPLVFAGRRICAVVCGSNIGLERYTTLLTGSEG